MAYTFFAARQLHPAGWLKRQLEIQAAGLAGNLDKVWPDVRDSAWIGGGREGWERVPYWLDGFIPLAYLLEDEDMIARAQKYIEAILARQEEDGWLCPCAKEKRAEYDTWAVQLMSKVLTVYYQCSGDERIPTVLYRMMKNYFDLLQAGTVTLFQWGKARWFEAFIALNFLNERYHEPWIADLAHILKEQGTDHTQIEDRWVTPKNAWTFETHVVNLAMMLRIEALTAPLCGNPKPGVAERHYDLLMRCNSTPVGIFTGDECLGGLSPIRGTELCAVVELMYSMEHLFAFSGDSKWAERLETVAFNALPATISDDMWSHQYDQLSNQIACRRFEKVPFGTNDEEANRFGLEPNFGCCTANFGQGWPKLALSAFLYKEGHILSALPLPCTLTASEADIRLETDYPFRNSFVYTVRAHKPFVFEVRIPSFAQNLRVNGKKRDREDYLRFALKPGETVLTITFDTTPEWVNRPNGLQTVKMGSLVFSVPIKAESKIVEYTREGVERKFPYCDYEITPASFWQYGAIKEPLKINEHEVGDVPFSSQHPPVTLTASAVPIDWGTDPEFDGFASPVPKSRRAAGKKEQIELYPYGCAKLRITEWPEADKEDRGERL